MKTIIVPFNAEMIPSAGDLLSKRQARNRARLSLLPVRFADPQVAARAVQALWGRKLKNGFAAVREGELVAYLIGELGIQPWGRVGYVYLPGYALVEGESPRVLQDLYARLGEEWVKNGTFIHDIYISAADTDILQAFFDIGFGKERVEGLLDLGALNIPDIPDLAGIEIRRAGKGDNEHLGKLSGIIASALASAPYWHTSAPEEYEQLRAGWAELAASQDWSIWLALEKNQVLGMTGIMPEPEEDTKILVSPGTVYFSLGVTETAARGRGISTALTWRSLKQAHEMGYKVCYINWISPNLLAARFWPRFGFTEVAYRLAKRVAPMPWLAREE